MIVRQEVESQCKEKYEYDSRKDNTLNDIQEIGKKLYRGETN